MLGKGNTSTLGNNPGEMGSSLPTVDLGSGRTPTDIFTFDNSSCASLTNGRIICWGLNDKGQMGKGNTSNVGIGPGQMGNNLEFISLK